MSTLPFDARMLDSGGYTDRGTARATIIDWIVGRPTDGLSTPAAVARVPGVNSTFGFASITEVEDALRAQSYLPQRGLATALFLALAIEKPLLLEGEAGVGQDRGGQGARQGDWARG